LTGRGRRPRKKVFLVKETKGKVGGMFPFCKKGVAVFCFLNRGMGEKRQQERHPDEENQFLALEQEVVTARKTAGTVISMRLGGEKERPGGGGEGGGQNDARTQGG